MTAATRRDRTRDAHRRPSPGPAAAPRAARRQRPGPRGGPPSRCDGGAEEETAPQRRPTRRDRALHGRRGQSGFVTAEMAAALPAVVAVLALGIWAVAAVGMKVRAIDAANSAAIAAARGEDPQAVAAAYLPEGGSVSVSTDGDVARAKVTAPTSPLGPLTPPLAITAEAAAPMEPGLPR
jgi:hypothetical protein